MIPIFGEELMARRTISLELLDKFSVDDETGQLYWRDREVITVVSLPWWVNWSAIAVAIGTVVVALVEVGKVVVHGF